MIRYLKSLLTILKSLIFRDEVVQNVNPSDLLTRYIFSKSHFAKSKGVVKYAAFLPYKMEASIYKVTGVDEGEIWELGRIYVEDLPNRRIKARADIKAQDIFEQNLCVVPDTKPHPLHANIKCWPTEKHEQQMLAIELARCSKLNLPD